MIQTFQQIWSEVQSSVHDTSASELILIKRDANISTQRFKSVMSRPWSRISKKANTVADQQDYQMPRSVLRPSGVSVLSGDTYKPLIEVSSESNWNRINSGLNLTSGLPQFYFPKGKDTISLFPIPSAAVTEGIKVFYEPKQPRMVSDDFTTGTVTATNGGTTITHSGTGFTESMVGQYFYVTDGSDGFDYQIVDYTDTSNLVLENFFEGISSSLKTFVIGCAPDIPDEYIPSVVDYCLGRFHIRRGDDTKGDRFLARFDIALDECKEVYASPTSDPNIQNLYDNFLNPLDNPPHGLS